MYKKQKINMGKLVERQGRKAKGPKVLNYGSQLLK